MKSYNEVFELIKNGDWTVGDFSKWLDVFDNQSWEQGYTEGYYNANLDNGDV
jgi:hypothetical protein